MNERSVIGIIAASVITLLLLVRSISSSTSSADTQHHPQPTSHDHHQASHHHSGMGHDNMMMMPMWFMWTVDTILWFHSWHPTSLLPYLGSCLLLVGFAILHEALASWRVSFAKSNTHTAPHGYVAVAGSERFKEKSLLQLRVQNSLLYTANITTGYMLMLAVMSFNVGYFLSVVAGMGLGHFLFFNKPWHLEMARVDACCETTVGIS